MACSDAARRRRITSAHVGRSFLLGISVRSVYSRRSRPTPQRCCQTVILCWHRAIADIWDGCPPRDWVRGLIKQALRSLPAVPASCSSRVARSSAFWTRWRRADGARCVLLQPGPRPRAANGGGTPLLVRLFQDIPYRPRALIIAMPAGAEHLLPRRGLKWGDAAGWSPRCSKTTERKRFRWC